MFAEANMSAFVPFEISLFSRPDGPYLASILLPLVAS